MYVSVLAVLLGESFLFRSWALARYAVAVGALYLLVVILYEEPVLQKKFGASYEEYRRNVSRWIPRLRRERSNR